MNIISNQLLQQLFGPEPPDIQLHPILTHLLHPVLTHLSVRFAPQIEALPVVVGSYSPKGITLSCQDDSSSIYLTINETQAQLSITWYCGPNNHKSTHDLSDPNSLNQINNIIQQFLNQITQDHDE